MTREHNTRNTSIRTRKIRGEDSFVSSISMSERAEGPEGIAGVIRSKSRFGGPIWHSAAEKKDQKAPFEANLKGNFALKPGLPWAYFAKVGCPPGFCMTILHRGVPAAIAASLVIRPLIRLPEGGGARRGGPARPQQAHQGAGPS